MTAPNRNSASLPNAGMKMSGPARAKMRSTEKVMLRYYNDMGGNKGNCTWGIGFYAHRGVCSEEELARVVDPASVDIEYGRRVAEAERQVKSKVAVPLSQEQFDALCSLTYNAGASNSKDVYRYVNQSDFTGAAAEISKMVKVRMKVKGKNKLVLAPGLIKRREEEAAPFIVNTTGSAAGK